MTKTSLLGPWVRRFLLEYLVSERNLTRNTQRSYRDTLSLLIPFVAQQAHKQIDQISVTDVSPDAVRLFLRHLEECRKCTPCKAQARRTATAGLWLFPLGQPPLYLSLFEVLQPHQSIVAFDWPG